MNAFPGRGPTGPGVPAGGRLPRPRSRPAGLRPDPSRTATAFLSGTPPQRSRARGPARGARPPVGGAGRGTLEAGRAPVLPAGDPARSRDGRPRRRCADGGSGGQQRPCASPAPRVDMPAPVQATPLKATFGPGFELKSADDEFQLQFHDLTQLDGRFYEQGGQAPVRDTFAFPRQWFIFSGRLTKPFEYYVSLAHGLRRGEHPRRLPERPLRRPPPAQGRALLRPLHLRVVRRADPVPDHPRALAVLQQLRAESRPRPDGLGPGGTQAGRLRGRDLQRPPQRLPRLQRRQGRRRLPQRPALRRRGDPGAGVPQRRRLGRLRQPAQRPRTPRRCGPSCRPPGMRRSASRSSRSTTTCASRATGRSGRSTWRTTTGTCRSSASGRAGSRTTPSPATWPTGSTCRSRASTSRRATS